MYIEYVRNQLVIRARGRLVQKKPNTNPEHIYEDFPGVPEFKPTWLVRVSDMKLVPGSSVNGHYWALSYSWDQSGKIIPKGGENYDRIDEGRHKIKEYQRIPGYKMEYGDAYITVDTDFDEETASTKLVMFEGLIQQICKDFDIDYIWYDQMCINQSNPEEKMREIKQMHRIYKNALCTVALVPELQRTIKNGRLVYPNSEILPSTQWCKRMWTLEEAYLSRHILFLGRDLHIWGNISFIWTLSSARTSYSIDLAKWKACTALWYARNRTSSKAHDRMFALANIFPELMDGITFSYDQPLHDLMLKFYLALAQNDPSILWFGAPLNSDPEGETTVVRQEEERVSRPQKYIRTLTKFSRAVKTIAALQRKALPSWTGANGVHIVQFDLDDRSYIVKPNYTIVQGCMYLTSRFITVRIEPASMVEKPDDFDNPDKYRYETGFNGIVTPCKQYYENGHGKDIYFTVDGLPMDTWYYNPKYVVARNSNGPTDLIFAATTSSLHRHQLLISDIIPTARLKWTHFLPLVIEDATAINTLSKPTLSGGYLSLTEECSECIILSEPMAPFKNLVAHRGYPVVKKSKGCYRSIGVFMPNHLCVIDSTLFRPEQTFDIV